MAISGAMKLRGSEGSGAVGVAGGVSEPARRSKSGRQDSSVVVAHCPRVTGTIEIPVPPKLVGSPVALPTWSSAIRASCSRRIRSSGSTLPSSPPSVAIESASWRAASHPMGPCWEKSLARSPKSGIPDRGFCSKFLPSSSPESAPEKGSGGRSSTTSG